MYITGSIQKYLDDLAAKLPAPGGGSSAALAGAMASALMSMVLNFTIGKPKYKDFEEIAKGMLVQTERLRTAFTKLFAEDITSYDGVSQAYKLPMSTDAEKAMRKAAIEKGLKQALLVPLEVCKASCEAIKFCPELARSANKNMICDVEVPVRLFEASFYSAKINVVMNQKGISDTNFNEDVSRQMERLEEELLRQKELSEKEIVKITGV